MENLELPNYTDFLYDYLSVNYPEIAFDRQFIHDRNILAQETFLSTMEKCNDYDLANELAIDVLLKDYKFSKFYCVLDVLFDEYQALFAKDILNSFALQFMPECEVIFGKYKLSDDFLRQPALMDLKHELKSFIRNKMNEYWSFSV